MQSEIFKSSSILSDVTRAAGAVLPVRGPAQPIAQTGSASSASGSPDAVVVFAKGAVGGHCARAYSTSSTSPGWIIPVPPSNTA